MTHIPNQRDRRILSFPAVHPCEGISPATLVASLITLSQNTCNFQPERFTTHRRNARETIRQIGIVSVFLHEIQDRAFNIPKSIVLSFSELHFTLQKIHFLMQDCTVEGARLLMLAKAQNVASQFRALIRAAATALDVLPLHRVEVGEEVKELVELVSKQARKAKFEVDPNDERANKRLHSVLRQFERGTEPDVSAMRGILDYLEIKSWNDCNREIKFLEDEVSFSECREREREVPLLSSLVGFLSYCRGVIFETLDNYFRNSDQYSEARCSTEMMNITCVNPEDFRCPISLELMTDPVTVSTGQTYDRASIEKWLKAGNMVCPKTGEKLTNKELVPNTTLKRLIHQFCSDNGISLARSCNRSRDITRTIVPGSPAAAHAMQFLSWFLTRRLVFGTEEQKTKAAYEVRVLSRNSIFNRACLIEVGVVPPLLSLLVTDDRTTQENAISALLKLSKHTTGPENIISSNGLNPILTVLKKGLTLEARQIAAAVIFYLSSVKEYRKLIGENPEAIPALVELVKEGTTCGKKNATVAIFGLLLLPRNHRSVLAAGAVPALVDILRREATADMSEDLSEGEKGDPVSDVSAHGGDSGRARLPRISSADAMEMWAKSQKGKKLYIVLISIHGLIRGENMELGRDSDTGGQVKYVVELARALGSMPGVYRVDLLTRQVSAPGVDWSYGEPTEMLSPRNTDEFGDDMGESSGAYIIRIPFGPRNKYIPKENLWPYISEFVDGALSHIIQMSKALGEQIGSGHAVWPVAIHGHYADAGDSAALLSGALNVPMLFTGHSLGRDKLEQLLKQGRLSRDEINTTYKIMRRIEAEELTLDGSEIVITSTRQEIEEQWRLYDGFDPVLERKLRARIRRNVSCYGRFMPRMAIIPPGMEFHHIVPLDGDIEGELEGNFDHPAPQDPPIWSEIMRFFTNPRKPMILALARPDPKKNITTLVKAFGECRPLRELANLTLIMGNRDGIDEMSSTNASVLLSVLKLIDKYDLYGQVAYPKHHKQSDVPDIYRLAAKTKGVFINPAFIEPFGLTLIEAAAYGLPMVATKNGGPVDIHRVLDNGLLVDPHDQQSIADALLKLVSNKQLWAKCRQNGLKNIHLFSWPEHCKNYLSKIATCKPRHPQWQRSEDGGESSESESPGDSLRDIQDLSLNLKFSLDGERSGDSGNDNSLDPDGNAADRSARLENAVLSWSKGISKDIRRGGAAEKSDQNSNAGKFPPLRRRNHLFVIAVDCDTISDLCETTKAIFESVGKERAEGSVGFILSTSLTISEIQSFLISGGLSPSDFDAYICNSGSDLYYPSLNPEDRPFVGDLYYHSHIEYRWGGEGLRKTLIRWASSITEKKGENDEQIVSPSEQLSTDYCYTFKVRKPGMAPPVKELRKLVRIQALRCHPIYCQNGTRLNVIPVLASRSQALRYLYVRWGFELSKMVVFVGECGDTDYEGLVGGLHKSVILKGVGSSAISQLHNNRNYPLSDVMPLDSPNIVEATEGSSSADIQALLEKVGYLTG